MSLPIYGTTNLDDVGTNAPTKTIEQTQGTPPASPNEDAPVAFATQGKGAPNDDNSNGPNTISGTKQIINQSFNEQITPQPNVLDQYASYTYNLAWYLMPPDAFNNMTPSPNVNEWVLIAKSGGAEAQTDASGNGKRSPFFPIDYYLDNLVIEAGLVGSGPGSQMATAGATSFSFQVTEPNGLTLPGALAGAVKDFYKQNNITAATPAESFFCMVIQFFGYDAQGNLVEAGRSGNQSGESSAASPRAIVKKFYPFVIQGFDFKLTSNGVLYNITGSAPSYNYNLGTMRGVIPAQFECVGVTVKDILVGTGDPTSVVAKAEGRDAEETPTVKTPFSPAADSAETAALFNDGTGYEAGYDPNAGWSA